jgi:hypothetical protein
MPDPVPDPAPSADENLAPWERAAAKPTKSLPGGAATGWHDSRTKDRSKRKQIVLAVVLFFGLAGVLIGMIAWLKPDQPEPELLAIPITEYRNIHWSSNPTAQRDADEILKQFNQAGGRASSDQEVNNLRSLLARMKARDDRKTPLMVFVSALVYVRDDKAYLLPADARLGSADSWVPFGDLLAATAGCNAEFKALVLDLARTPADPFRGPLHDDAMAQIDRELTAFNPQFPVLASCSPGERSLVIPEQGLSAFAAFLSEGLRGEADGYRPGQEPDGKLTFAELADFTIARVSQWADQVPDVRQMPKRYGPAGEDFLLFRERSRSKKEPADGETQAPPVPPGYPAELRDAWKIRDAQRDLGSYLAPDLILDLDLLLLRAEERYLLGLPFEDPRSDPAWATAVTRLRTRTNVLDASLPIPPSLVDLRAGRKPLTPELSNALDRWYKLRFPPKDDAGKPMPVPPAELEKSNSEVEKLMEGDAATEGFAYFWVLLVRDTNTSVSAERVANVLTLIEDDRMRRLRLTGEQLLLRRIAKAKLPEAAYPDAVRSMLEAEQALAAAIAALGGRLPEGFTRLQVQLAEAAKRKQELETRLFQPRPNSDELEAIHQELKLAIALLNGVRDDAVKLRAAHRAWADAALQLHAAAPGMIAVDDPSLESWLDAARQTQDLATRLTAEGSFSRPEIEAIDGLAARVRRATTAIAPRDGAPDRIKTLTENAQQRPQSTKYADLRRLLYSPALTAEQRDVIAAGFRKVSAYRTNESRAKFDKEHIKTPVEHPKSEDPFTRTQRRAAVSIELLRLAGSPEAEKLALAARSAGSDLSKWQSVNDRLIAAWSREMPAAVAADEKKNRWRPVERIVRAAPARFDGFNREGGFGKLFTSEEIERRKWLSDRYRQYGKLRSGVPDAPGFYGSLAEEFDRPLPNGGR